MQCYDSTRGIVERHDSSTQAATLEPGQPVATYGGQKDKPLDHCATLLRLSTSLTSRCYDSQWIDYAISLVKILWKTDKLSCPILGYIGISLEKHRSESISHAEWLHGNKNPGKFHFHESRQIFSICRSAIKYFIFYVRKSSKFLKTDSVKFPHFSSKNCSSDSEGIHTFRLGNCIFLTFQMLTLRRRRSREAQ